jgi:hypothetical protein
VLNNSVVSVTWIRTTDEKRFGALLKVMGKGYTYRKFLDWCSNPTNSIIVQPDGTRQKEGSPTRAWRRLKGPVFCYWSNPGLKMAVSVEVVNQNKAWNLARASFAFADDWMEARKAVRELNEGSLSRDYTGPLIKKDLSRKRKIPEVWTSRS